MKDRRSTSISKLQKMADATGTDDSERGSLTPEPYKMSAGTDRNSCSTPTRKNLGIVMRRRVVNDDDQSRARRLTEKEETRAIVDPPLHSFHMNFTSGKLKGKGKTLIHDEDAPPGFGFIAKPRTNLRTMIHSTSPQLPALAHQKSWENSIPSSVMERCGSNIQALPSKPVVSDRHSRVKESSNSVHTFPRFTTGEDELLSTASYNKHLVDTEDSDTDASSVHNLDNDDDSNITTTHGVTSESLD